MSTKHEGISIAEKPPQAKPDPGLEAKKSLARIKNKFIVMSGKCRYSWSGYS